MNATGTMSQGSTKVTIGGREAGAARFKLYRGHKLQAKSQKMPCHVWDNMI